jgi:tetratricopeptide (TPR) repeat protein
LDPHSYVISRWLGEVYYWTRKYDKAIEQLRAAAELAPDLPDAYISLGQVYEQKGMEREAVTEYLQARVVHGESEAALELLRRAFANEGIKGFWRKVLELEDDKSKSEEYHLYLLAAVHKKLGDKDRALSSLRTLLKDNPSKLSPVGFDPVFDPLRSDPRFQALLRRNDSAS